MKGMNGLLSYCRNSRYASVTERLAAAGEWIENADPRPPCRARLVPIMGDPLEGPQNVSARIVKRRTILGAPTTSNLSCTRTIF
jgi:hypothetical protein